MHLHTKGVVLGFCPKCGKKVRQHSVCQHCGYYKGVEVIYRDPETGSYRTRDLDKKDLVGSFKVKLNVGESIPDNVLIRREEAWKFLEVFGNHPDFDDVELSRKVFDDYERFDFDKIYNGSPAKTGSPGTPAVGYGLTNSMGRRGQPGVPQSDAPAAGQGEDNTAAEVAAVRNRLAAAAGKELGGNV